MLTLEADPRLTKVLEVMTANIATRMNERLEKMVHNINSNISQSLKEVTDRVSEAEQRILMVENTSTDSEQHLLVWKKW